jgi:hypothetical protein
METTPLERRLAAILAVDVEGYSRLMHGDEEATMATCSPNSPACSTRFAARSRSRNPALVVRCTYSNNHPICSDLALIELLGSQ